MTTATRARVGSVLREAVARFRRAGIATARQDAELLLARVRGTGRLALHLGARDEMSDAALADFEALVVRRAGQEPIQYILGETEFCGVRFSVGPGVFIPRPETELLVERALGACPGKAGLVLEPCTGSGAVACALAAVRPGVSVWATEISPAALDWARGNTGRLGLMERVIVLEGDLFAPVAGGGLAGRCDVVVANPPYIARSALASVPDEVRRWEPERALDGGPEGLSVIGRILAEAPDFLRAGGTLLIEIGHDQGDRLRGRLAADPRYEQPVVHRDLAGRERVLQVRRT